MKSYNVWKYDVVYPYLCKNKSVNHVYLSMSLLVILWIGAINNNNINWTNAEEQENKRIARIVVNKEKRMATNMSDIVTPTKETK